MKESSRLSHCTPSSLLNEGVPCRSISSPPKPLRCAPEKKKPYSRLAPTMSSVVTAWAAAMRSSRVPGASATMELFRNINTPLIEWGSPIRASRYSTAPRAAGEIVCSRASETLVERSLIAPKSYRPGPQSGAPMRMLGPVPMAAVSSNSVWRSAKGMYRTMNCTSG